MILKINQCVKIKDPSNPLRDAPWIELLDIIFSHATCVWFPRKQKKKKLFFLSPSLMGLRFSGTQTKEETSTQPILCFLGNQTTKVTKVLNIKLSFPCCSFPPDSCETSSAFTGFQSSSL